MSMSSLQKNKDASCQTDLTMNNIYEVSGSERRELDERSTLLENMGI